MLIICVKERKFECVLEKANNKLREREEGLSISSSGSPLIKTHAV